MRQQHYRFAHEVLRDAVLANPELWWNRLHSAASASLAGLWEQAGEGLPATELVEAPALDAMPMPLTGGEALLVALPRPTSPTECHYAALIRPGGQKRIRYFVMELGLPSPESGERAYWAEWRIAPGGGVMRVRGADLPCIGASAFLQAIEGKLANLFADEPGPTVVASNKAAPAAQPARSSGSSKKLALLIVFGAVLLGGGWLLYLEEFRGIHVPTEAVAAVPFEPDRPFGLTFIWNGTGYAFNNVWLVIEEGEPGPEGIVIQGKVRFGTSTYEHPVKAVFPGRGAHRVQSEGGKVSGWLYLADEYRYHSSSPVLCNGSLSVVSGKIQRARIVVSQAQRPADWIHF
ncbi:MAG: hypothetical protein QM765_51170 [Myxococcales bacterium]